MPKKKETTTTPKKKTTKKVSVNKVSTTEKNDYTKMTDYIQELYLKRGIDDPPWALLMTQVKDIVNKYGLSYIEILHILKYMVQIEGIDFTDKDTLGLVPYYINKTDKYMVRYKEIKKITQDFQFDEKTIAVSPQKNHIRYKKKNESFD